MTSGSEENNRWVRFKNLLDNSTFPIPGHDIHDTRNRRKQQMGYISNIYLEYPKTAILGLDDNDKRSRRNGKMG